MNSVDSNITALIRNIVRSSDHDPALFKATTLSGARIQITSGCVAAVYPPDGWTTKFSQHLQAGYFDQKVTTSGV